MNTQNEYPEGIISPTVADRIILDLLSREVCASHMYTTDKPVNFNKAEYRSGKLWRSKLVRSSLGIFVAFDKDDCTVTEQEFTKAVKLEIAELVKHVVGRKVIISTHHADQVGSIYGDFCFISATFLNNDLTKSENLHSIIK